MPDYHRPEFGEAVRRLLQERGLTLRSQRVRTGIDHTTMKSMCDGFVPRLEKVEQFARGFGLDVNEWRELAGYERVEGAPLGLGDASLSGDDVLRQGVLDLMERYHVTEQHPRLEHGRSSLTPDEAYEVLRSLEMLIETGVIKRQDQDDARDKPLPVLPADVRRN